MTISRRIISAVAFFFIISVPHLSAGILSSQKYGYAIDLPEAFKSIQQDSDGKGYLYAHTLLPVTFAIKIYDMGEYKSAVQALDGVLGKLSAAGEKDSIKWRNTDCVISSYTMKLPGSDKGQKGWALSAVLSDHKTDIVLLCYADEDVEHVCENLILSVLDSLMIDRGSFFEAGPVTSYAYPGSSKKNIELTINGRKIQTVIDAEDAEAAKSVVDREYAVLTLFANHASWKEAWQRYYRMVFRDSYGRLKKPSADIYRALISDASKADSKNPDAGLAQILLTWTQNFTYARNNKSKNTSDFTDLISTLTGAGNDCDSRSLLLCALMENSGVKSTLFVSAEYSHAVAGFDIDKAGAKIKVSGKEYLLAETTAHVDIGRIAQEQSDTNKWIAVELP